MDQNNTFSTPLPLVGVSILQIIYAAVTLLIGYIALRITVNLLERTMRKLNAPEMVIRVTGNLVNAIGWLIIIVATASALGLETGPVILGLSAIFGLILGFGLQDTFANLAAGVWLAIYRPFEIGDFVNINGNTGTVRDLTIMAVELATPDNVYVFIPNKSVWGSVIINYSRYDTRRLDLVVGVAYGTDLDVAAKLMLEIAKNHPKTLKDPAPQVIVSELADSSINLTLRLWAKREDYWNVRNDLIKKIYEVFNANNIEIPYPQMDIHIRDMPASK